MCGLKGARCFFGNEGTACTVQIALLHLLAWFKILVCVHWAKLYFARPEEAETEVTAPILPE